MKIIHCDIVAAMKLLQTSLTRIHQNGLAVCFEFDHDLHNIVQPGQYLMARGDGDILPVPLFPCGIEGRQYTSLVPLNRNWQPGDLLTIRYPLGKGFSLLPGSTRRLLMVSGTDNPLRLLPVAGSVIKGGGEAALFTYHLPEQVPVEIELLTRDQLTEAVSWADCIIGDAALSDLPVWKKLVFGENSLPTKKTIQILVDTPMICCRNGGMRCVCRENPAWLEASLYRWAGFPADGAGDLGGKERPRRPGIALPLDEPGRDVGVFPFTHPRLFRIRSSSPIRSARARGCHPLTGCCCHIPAAFYCTPVCRMPAGNPSDESTPVTGSNRQPRCGCI